MTTLTQDKIVYTASANCAESALFSDLVYNVGEQTAYLIFERDGAVWQYAGISEQLWDTWRTSDSLGSFYSHNIRGRFEAQPIGVADEFEWDYSSDYSFEVVDAQEADVQITATAKFLGPISELSAFVDKVSAALAGSQIEVRFTVNA